MILNIWVKQMNRKTKRIIILFLSCIIMIIGSYYSQEQDEQTGNSLGGKEVFDISNVPEYTGQIYVEINNNNPKFTDEDMNLEEDYYSSLKNGKVRSSNDKNKLEKSKCR